MEYDFYYSVLHEANMKHFRTLIGNEYHDTYVNGMIYTEMIEANREPMTKHFKDLEKIYTGSCDKISIKKGDY